jgi:hypothetical protein
VVLGVIMSDLGYFSRFQTTESILVEGKKTFGAWNSPDFIKKRPDKESILTYHVTSKTEGRPDLISNIVYGTSDLFWVIIAFNKPRNTLNWPKTGSTIEYPAQSVVMSELL